MSSKLASYLKDIPASDVLDKIKKGESVEYDNVRVIGDIDIKSCNLKKVNGKFVVSSSIKITNSLIENNIMFFNTLFETSINFVGTSFENNVDFHNSIFSATYAGSVDFTEAKFHGTYNYFNGVTFCGPTEFRKTTFDLWAEFEGATFESTNYFFETTFAHNANFNKTTFNRDSFFNKVTFVNFVWFEEAIFNSDISFDEVTFVNYVSFERTLFNGDLLTFKNARFQRIENQEIAYRKAKMVLEKAGNRVDADYHFYHEMVAKRQQKDWYARYLEYLFLELIFGYGVHPLRLIVCFPLIILAFSGLYWIFNVIEGNYSITQYIWFSFTSAIMPGYTSYTLKAGIVPVFLAGIEAIIGFFLWGTFITTFARKYMR